MSLPRALVLSLAAAAALALPAGAHAQRAWQPPAVLSGAISGGTHTGEWDTALTMTSQGEAVATWMEQTGPEWFDTQTMIAVRSPLGGSSGPQPLEGAAAGNRVRLVSDALGNAYLAYADAGGTTHFKVRPPGGSFGSEELLSGPPNAGTPMLVAAPGGDVAALWFDSGVSVSLRPAGGTFGPREHLLDYSLAVSGVAARYSANGELVVGSLSSMEHGGSGRAYGTVRSPDGTVSTTPVSEPTARAVTGPSMGVDDAGRAVFAWGERASDGSANGVAAALVAQRPSGGAFGAPVALSRAGGFGPTPQVVTGRDGTFTVAYMSKRGVRVAVGRTGEAPRHLRTYYNNTRDENVRLAGSPSGSHALLSHGVSSSNVATSARSGDGGFGPSTDVRTDCGGSDFMRLAVGDGGQGAALILTGRQALLVTDAAGTGTRDCVPDYYPEYNPSPYDDDPYVARTHGGPNAGGAWEPDGDPYPPTGGGGGGGGFFTPPGALPVGNPMLVAARAGATKRRARVMVVCGKPCSIGARAALAFEKGKPLVRGSARGSSKGKPKLIEIPLTVPDSVLKAIARWKEQKAPKPRLLVTIEVTASLRGEKKKRTREVAAVVGDPGAPF